MYIKTTVRFHWTPTSLSIVKNTDSATNCGWGQVNSHTDCGSSKWRGHLENWQFCIKLNLHFPGDPAFPPLSVSSRKIKTHVFTKIFASMFTSALFVTVEKWKHPEPVKERGWSVPHCGHGCTFRPPAPDTWQPGVCGKSQTPRDVCHASLSLWILEQAKPYLVTDSRWVGTWAGGGTDASCTWAWPVYAARICKRSWDRTLYIHTLCFVWIVRH